MTDEAPKIHVDSDWKQQAQAEKQRMAKKAAEAAQQQGGQGAAGQASGAGRQRQADFATLVSTMATQALFALGEIPDPRTGQRMMSLEMARHQIDMLGVIEEKTRGNLSEEEQAMLSGTVYELRSRYIAAATSQTGRGGGGGGGAGAGPAPASGGDASGFVGPGL